MSAADRVELIRVDELAPVLFELDDVRWTGGSSLRLFRAPTETICDRGLVCEECLTFALNQGIKHGIWAA